MSPPKDDVGRARVAEILSYDPASGSLTWKTVRGRRCQPGGIAGCVGRDGYRTVSIDGKAYKAHRLAWLLSTGKWPKEQLDHINHIRDDNRLENMREATKSANQIHARTYKNNKSGYRGVHFHKAANKWVAEVRRDNVIRHLGCFDSAEAAHACRMRELR